jgi:uncharacterized protein (UPF0332 family)
MEAWERWWNMAQGSLAAAQLLAKEGEVRSSASCAYYAAYQAITAVLLYARQIPPAGREAWSHEATPDLIRRLSGTIISEDARKDIQQRLEACYKLRIDADYISQVTVDEAKLKLSLKDAAFITKLANDVFS